MKKAHLVAWTCSCLAVALGVCGLLHADGGASVVKSPGQGKAAGKEPNGAATRPATQPATAPAPRLAEWIAQLGSDKVAERDAAQKAMVQAGKGALEALRAAANDKDLERASRAKAAIGEITLASRRGSRFAIYLVSTPSEMQGAREASLANLELESDPLYAEEDIVRYEWPEHILHLTPDARRRVLLATSSFMPFVFVANGERCYLGALFLSYPESHDTAVPCISIPSGEKLPADAVRISGGGRNDPRGDPRIHKALEAAGKLKAASTQPATRPAGGAFWSAAAAPPLSLGRGHGPPEREGMTNVEQGMSNNEVRYPHGADALRAALNFDIRHSLFVIRHSLVAQTKGAA